jgi:N-alpha-acetyltransferase 15/16, NatA auxiliary subunit
VHDDPSLAVIPPSKETEAAKKAKKKAKKAAQKVQDEAKKGKQKCRFQIFSTKPLPVVAAPISEDKGLDVGPAKDDDPDGSKLLASKDGLEKAAKLLNPLTTLAPQNTDAWIAVYDVAIRRSELQNISIQSRY